MHQILALGVQCAHAIPASDLRLPKSQPSHDGGSHQHEDRLNDIGDDDGLEPTQDGVGACYDGHDQNTQNIGALFNLNASGLSCCSALQCLLHLRLVDQ